MAKSRELIPGVHTFRNFAEVSMPSRTHLVENARTYAHLTQRDEKTSCDLNPKANSRFDIDDMTNWPAKHWCFVREGLSSSTGVSRIVASGCVLLTADSQLELYLLHYDLERPEAGVQVLEALLKDVRADLSWECHIGCDIVVRATSSVDAAVHRFARNHKFVLVFTECGENVVQDNTKQITYILRANSAVPLTPKHSRPVRLSHVRTAERSDARQDLLTSPKFVPRSSRQVPLSKSVLSKTPTAPKYAPTPHCTPAPLPPRINTEMVSSLHAALKVLPNATAGAKESSHRDLSTGHGQWEDTHAVKSPPRRCVESPLRARMEYVDDTRSDLELSIPREPRAQISELEPRGNLNDEVVEDRSSPLVDPSETKDTPPLPRRRSSKTSRDSDDDPLHSLAANPESVYSVLSTLERLSAEVAILKKERAASARSRKLLLAEQNSDNSSVSEQLHRESKVLALPKCKPDDTNTCSGADSSTARKDSVAPIRSARQVERDNYLIENLRHQFGFPYEAIVRVACNSSATSTRDDEFDVVHALFRENYLRNVNNSARQSPNEQAADNSEEFRANCLKEEGDLRTRGGVYDSREQVWRVPLPEKMIEPRVKEKCVLHIYVAPAHQRCVVLPTNVLTAQESASHPQGTTSVIESTPPPSTLYPFEIPPFFVESDCGRFRGADSDRLIRAAATEMELVRKANLRGEPFLVRMVDVASKLVEDESRSGSLTIGVPTPLRASCEHVGVVRGAVSALATLPAMLREAGKHAATEGRGQGDLYIEEPLLRGLVESICSQDSEGLLKGSVSLALQAVFQHELTRKAEISGLRLAASDLTSQVEILRQLRSKQQALRSVELKGLLWKHVESRIKRHKSHVRLFFLDGATLSWQPTPNAKLSAKLVHQFSTVAKSSHAKSIELTASTEVSFPAIGGEKPSSSPRALSNFLGVRRHTATVLMSPTTCATPLTSNALSTCNNNTGTDGSDGEGFMTPSQAGKLPARKQLGYTRESFSKVSVSRASIFSAVSRSTRRSSVNVEESVFSISDMGGRTLVLHGNSRAESERWAQALQRVVTLMQEIEQLESHV